MKVFFLLLIISSHSFGSDYTSELKKEGHVKIDPVECSNIEKKLGQLLYATIYLFSPTHTGNEKYLSMVKDLNLGGVLPHYYPATALGKKGVDQLDKSIYEWNKEIKASTPLPTLVGVDYVKKRCGLGYGQGVLAKFPKECSKDYFQLQAACHSAYGINHALGPTVEHNENNTASLNQKDYSQNASSLIDSFNNYGIPTTLKHFPYTPTEYNLHKQSEDTKLTPELVNTKMQNFTPLADKADFAMTTHLYNSLVDEDDMATFSKKWITKLREEVGFKGLLMTDALFMIQEYDDNIKQMSRKWDSDKWKKSLDDQSVFAVRSILAGHDMVFLDGDVENTRTVFKDLLYVACEDNDISAELRKNVDTSFKRITDYKEANKKVLLQQPPFNAKFVKLASEIAIMQPEDPKFCALTKKALSLIKKQPSAIQPYKFEDKGQAFCPAPGTSQPAISEFFEDIEKVSPL